MTMNNSNITKKDIVEDIALRTGLTQVDTKVIIESFLSSVVKAMSEGNNIEIRGFGRFKIKERKARKARNPKTGEDVIVKAGIKPVFEASRELKKFLNESSIEEIFSESIESKNEQA